MKVAGYRAALYPLCTEHITLGSAYSDTAVVTSCSRRIPECKVMNYDFYDKLNTVAYSSSCAAATALGIRPEIEQLRITFFIERF